MSLDFQSEIRPPLTNDQFIATGQCIGVNGTDCALSTGNDPEVDDQPKNRPRHVWRHSYLTVC